MIHKIRVTQIGTLFSEGIDDLPQEQMRRPQLVRPARMRVMRLLKDTMTLMDNVPRQTPARARPQDRSKRAM